MKKFCKILIVLIWVFAILGGLMVEGTLLYKKYVSGTEDADHGSFTYSTEAAVDSIECDMSYGNLELVPGDAWSVRFEDVYIPMAEAFTEGSTLKIQLNTENDFVLFGWKIGVDMDFDFSKEPVVTVTFPAGSQLELVNIQTGHGSVSIEGLDTGLFVCQTGIGSISLKDCRLTEESASQLVFGTYSSENVMYRFGKVHVTAGTASIGVDETSRLADVETKVRLGCIK